MDTDLIDQLLDEGDLSGPTRCYPSPMQSSIAPIGSAAVVSRKFQGRFQPPNSQRARKTLAQREICQSFWKYYFASIDSRILAIALTYSNAVHSQLLGKAPII